MGLSTHKPFIVSAPTRSRCVETFEKIGQRLREYHWTKWYISKGVKPLEIWQLFKKNALNMIIRHISIYFQVFHPFGNIPFRPVISC